MNNPRNAYLASMVTTASPARLLVLLYDRLLRDLQQAAELQDAGAHLEAAPHLLHAQEIVLELHSSLQVDVWEGAERLSAIYTFLHRELVRANVKCDVEVTRSCHALVEPLADAWRQAALAGAEA
ncbi:MAG: flagellar export chaperone FliS [Nocardioidaceae bacterium]|nr:flagellar export chaperone FliS [Nocardioidaceae bacterium]NUS50559.1 flagellar export chaperone FliS [Nocardioidaceae bacterium]